MTNYLTELRTVTNLSQRHIAKEVGVHHSTIQRFEKGERELPTEVLEQVSKVIAQKLSTVYVAGLFDRSSCLSIVKVLPNRKKYTKADGNNTGPINFPVYSVRVRFRTSSKLLATVLEQFFGSGFVYHSCGDGWTLVCAHKKSRIVLETLLPYLIVKRTRAVDLLKVLDILDTKPRMRTPLQITNLESGYSRVLPSAVEVAKVLKRTVSTVMYCVHGRTHSCAGHSIEQIPVNTDSIIELENLYIRNRVKWK